MSATAALVVAAVALLTLLALAAVVWTLIRRVKRLARTVGDIQRKLGPTLAQVSREAEAAQQQLERISARSRAGSDPAIDEASGAPSAATLGRTAALHEDAP